MASHVQPFARPPHKPVRTRRVSAAIVVAGLHLFVAYLAFTFNFVRAVRDEAREADLAWITLTDPERNTPDPPLPPNASPLPPRDGVRTFPSPRSEAPPQTELSTAITPPETPGLEVLGPEVLGLEVLGLEVLGLEVLGAYVACGLPGDGVQTIEDREACERTRAMFGDGAPKGFVQTDAERALWTKFAQDKRVQDAGVFSVCSNRGGVTIALTIRLIGGEWLVGDASNARRKADTNMLDDSNMPGTPQFGCDTPEGALFKPRLR